jgi:hypothetical protein
MLKKTITYENADGVEVTRDFYFHITQAELMEQMLVSPDDDPEARLRRILASDDRKAIMVEFKALIANSVGRRTENGDFIKTPEYAQSFMTSEPYSELFAELMGSTEKVTEFINGLMPKKLRAQAEAAMRDQDATVVELPNSGVIEGIAGDAAAQAEKPQPVFDTPEHLRDAKQFPQVTEAAIIHNQQAQSTDNSDNPPWLREGRQPTRKEMMRMTTEELQFVFKMREAGLIS